MTTMLVLLIVRNKGHEDGETFSSMLPILNYLNIHNWFESSNRWTSTCDHGTFGQKCENYVSLQEECALHTSLEIEKMNSLDYGSGMAYNYFYGYLRLVLPDPEVGTQAAKGMFIYAIAGSGPSKYYYTVKNIVLVKLKMLITL
jgi:hypothetical protein